MKFPHEDDSWCSQGTHLLERLRAVAEELTLHGKHLAEVLNPTQSPKARKPQIPRTQIEI